MPPYSASPHFYPRSFYLPLSALFFLLFFISVIWTTFPFSLYCWCTHRVRTTCPSPRHTMHPSCTTTTPHCCPHHRTTAVCIPPPWRPPLGSPVETPGEVWLCMGMTWHLPCDCSRMYIIAPGVGTKEAAFFSSSHFRLSGQGCSPCNRAATMHSCSLPHQVPSTGRYTGTLLLSELSLTHT